jgi:hypothetical protein
LLVGAFHLATIREGQDWGDDFSMYIRHAENVARGRPYAETGYIYNPHNPSVGPRAYPPAFPLLLAPVVKLFGLDLRPMQVLVVVFLVGSLLMLLRLFRGVLPSPYLEALVLVTGFSPVLWELKDQVLSDIPFVFFTLVSLSWFTQSAAPDTSPRRRAAYAALAGLVAYVSYATRVLGIVLVPTFLAHDLIRRRKVGLAAWTACSVFIILAGAQQVFWLRDRSYLDQLTVTAASVGRNLIDYSRSLSDVWDNGYSDGARKGLFLATGGLAAVGYARSLGGNAGVLEVFPWLYLAPVILWPSSQGIRFLIPVLPFFFFYCLLGAREMDGAVHGRWGRRNIVLVALLAAVAVTYAGRYSTLPRGRFVEGIAKQESVELFEFVRAATDPNDVFIFSKPRALALFTGRRAAAPFSPADPCLLWRYIAEIGASYVVTGPEALNPDVIHFQRFVDEFQRHFRVVQANQDFAVYRIEQNPCEPSR